MAVLNPFIATMQSRIKSFGEDMVVRVIVSLGLIRLSSHLLQRGSPNSTFACSIYCADTDELRKEALAFIGNFLSTHIKKIEEHITIKQRVQVIYEIDFDLVFFN